MIRIDQLEDVAAALEKVHAAMMLYTTIRGEAESGAVIARLDDLSAAVRVLDDTWRGREAGYSRETSIAIEWAKGDGLITAIRDDTRPVWIEGEKWRSALLDFAPDVPAGGWRDLMISGWARIDWAQVVIAVREGA